MSLKNMREVADAAGVSYSALQSALFHKKLVEPKNRAGSVRIFVDTEVEIIKNYFKNRKRRKK